MGNLIGRCKELTASEKYRLLSKERANVYDICKLFCCSRATAFKIKRIINGYCIRDNVPVRRDFVPMRYLVGLATTCGIECRMDLLLERIHKENSIWK